jgi:SAM-dependent methyltransferase
VNGLVTEFGKHGAHWFARADPVDLRTLAHAVAPVLDVGCGAGRHVLALAESGLVSLGVDVTPRAVALARARGAAVLERDVFSRIPGAGRWASALLLDGNIGIGGDPVRLLTRVCELLRPQGHCIVECSPERLPHGDVASLVVDATLGPWFAWTVVGADAMDEIAVAAAMRIERRWDDGSRHFVVLERP